VSHERGAETGEKALPGEILLEKGLISKENLEQALRVQVGGLRRLGHILIRMKCISDENLTDALSEQLRTPIIKVADEARPGLKTVLPRYLCRKYSVIPSHSRATTCSDWRWRIRSTGWRSRMSRITRGSSFSRRSRTCLTSTRRSRSTSHSPARHLQSADVSVRSSVAASVALLLLLVTGFLVYREMQRQRFGIISRVGDSVIFKNHD